jgi:hypothetical protein
MSLDTETVATLASGIDTLVELATQRGERVDAVWVSRESLDAALRTTECLSLGYGQPALLFGVPVHVDPTLTLGEVRTR